MPYRDNIHDIVSRGITEAGAVKNYADLVLKDGFHITNTELNAVSDGVSYVTGRIFEAVATNGYAVLHIKTGSKIAVMSYQVLCDALVYYGVYTGATVTSDGTGLPERSRNLVTVIAPTAQAFHTPTYTGGDVIVPRTNAAVSGPAKGAAGGGDSRTLVIPPNTSIIIQAQNKASNAALISIVAEWLEV